MIMYTCSNDHTRIHGIERKLITQEPLEISRAVVEDEQASP